jgi:hypothetical protein
MSSSLSLIPRENFLRKVYFEIKQLPRLISFGDLCGFSIAPSTEKINNDSGTISNPRAPTG